MSVESQNPADDLPDNPPSLNEEGQVLGFLMHMWGGELNGVLDEGAGDEADEDDDESPPRNLSDISEGEFYHVWTLLEKHGIKIGDDLADPEKGADWIKEFVYRRLLPPWAHKLDDAVRYRYLTPKDEDLGLSQNAIVDRVRRSTYDDIEWLLEYRAGKLDGSDNLHYCQTHPRANEKPVLTPALEKAIADFLIQVVKIPQGKGKRQKTVPTLNEKNLKKLFPYLPTKGQPELIAVIEELMAKLGLDLTDEAGESIPVEKRLVLGNGSADVMRKYLLSRIDRGKNEEVIVVKQNELVSHYDHFYASYRRPEYPAGYVLPTREANMVNFAGGKGIDYYYNPDDPKYNPGGDKTVGPWYNEKTVPRDRNLFDIKKIAALITPKTRCIWFAEKAPLSEENIQELQAMLDAHPNQNITIIDQQGGRTLEAGGVDRDCFIGNQLDQSTFTLFGDMVKNKVAEQFQAAYGVFSGGNYERDKELIELTSKVDSMGICSNAFGLLLMRLVTQLALKELNFGEPEVKESEEAPSAKEALEGYLSKIRRLANLLGRWQSKNEVDLELSGEAGEASLAERKCLAMMLWEKMLELGLDKDIDIDALCRGKSKEQLNRALGRILAHSPDWAGEQQSRAREDSASDADMVSDIKQALEALYQEAQARGDTLTVSDLARYAHYEIRGKDFLASLERQKKFQAMLVELVGEEDKEELLGAESEIEGYGYQTEALADLLMEKYRSDLGGLVGKVEMLKGDLPDLKLVQAIGCDEAALAKAAGKDERAAFMALASQIMKNKVIFNNIGNTMPQIEPPKAYFKAIKKAFNFIKKGKNWTVDFNNIIGHFINRRLYHVGADLRDRCGFEVTENMDDFYEDMGERILFGNGSSDIIFKTIAARINPGDKVVILGDAQYPLLDALIHLFGGIPVYCPLTKDKKPDYEKLDELVRDPRVKMVSLNIPNNPEGYSWGKKDLKQITKVVDGCGNQNITYFQDCAYDVVAWDAEGNPVKFADANGENLTVDYIGKYTDRVTVHSFSPSKRASVLGPRSGHAYISGDLSDADPFMHALHDIDSMLGENNPFGKFLYEILIDHPEYRVDVKELRKRAKDLAGGLNSIDGVNCPMPFGGLYVFFEADFDELDMKDAVEFCTKLNDEKNVLLTNGPGFGPAASNKFKARSIFFLPPTTNAETVERIREFVENHRMGGAQRIGDEQQAGDDYAVAA